MSSEPTVPRAVVTNHFLSGVLGAPVGNPRVKKDEYRRYAATARTSAVLQDNSESRVVSIQYEVGRVYEHIKDALGVTTVGTASYDAMYDTHADLRDDFINLARKYSNFSSVFEITNLAGVVERLGKALACASLYDNLESSHLRSTNELTIHTLGAADAPITALTNAVFIPRLVETQMNQNIFSVLANAVAGEGSAVATDVVELDATTRRPLISSVSGSALTAAIVGSLRILGGNMAACNVGSLFGYALARGLHSVLTVVGHTDEGGFMRDVFRRGAFSPPFGGIHSGLDVYTGIPALQTGSFNAVAAYCDAILLTTAAGVAFADPCVELRGSIFPFLSNGTTASDPEVDPGAHLAGTDAMVARHRSQINSVMDKFGNNYAGVLGRIFGCGGGEHHVARHLSACAISIPDDNRHLKFASVTPFFWIEPTSLLPISFCPERARLAGSCSLGDVGTDVSHPLFESISPYGSCDAYASAFAVQVRSARTTPMLYHWLGNSLNGLSSVRVRQMDPMGIVQPGGSDATGTVEARLKADSSIASYLWKRGQSPFPAPGEFLNLNATLGIYVSHVSLDDDGIPSLEHVPTTAEFLSSKVTINVSRPTGLKVGKSNTYDASVRRARTRATRELAAANARYGTFGRADHAAMPISFCPPRLNAPTVKLDPVVLPADTEQQTADRVDKKVEKLDPGVTDVHGDQAEPVSAAPQYTAVRAPTLAREGGVNVGGGAASERARPTERSESNPSTPWPVPDTTASQSARQ